MPVVMSWSGLASTTRNWEESNGLTSLNVIHHLSISEMKSIFRCVFFLSFIKRVWHISDLIVSGCSSKEWKACWWRWWQCRWGYGIWGRWEGVILMIWSCMPQHDLLWSLSYASGTAICKSNAVGKNPKLQQSMIFHEFSPWRRRWSPMLNQHQSSRMRMTAMMMMLMMMRMLR